MGISQKLQGFCPDPLNGDLECRRLKCLVPSWRIILLGFSGCRVWGLRFKIMLLILQAATLRPVGTFSAGCNTLEIYTVNMCEACVWWLKKVNVFSCSRK